MAKETENAQVKMETTDPQVSISNTNLSAMHNIECLDNLRLSIDMEEEVNKLSEQCATKESKDTDST